MMSSAIRRASFAALMLLVAACSGPFTDSTSTFVAPEATPAEAGGELRVAPTSTSTPEPTATSTPTPIVVPTATTVPSPTVEPATPTRSEADDTATEFATEEADNAGSSEATETRDAPLTAEEFASEVDALLDEREGSYHVVVIEPRGGPEYRRNDGVQLQAASLFKLLIMVEVFKQVEEGRIALDDPVVLYSGYFSEAGYDDPFGPERIGDTATVEELVAPMVMFSSNVAAYALLDVVGNANINATIASLGMTSSEIRWMPRRVADGSDRELAQADPTEEETPPPTADEAYNVTSAADMALLFDLLIKGEVVSPEASERMLELLAGQVVNNRLPALLPFGTVVAHKTGNIDNVVHDAGVIYAPGGPAVVAVLTADAVEWEAIEFMQELALLVYDVAGG